MNTRRIIIAGATLAPPVALGGLLYATGNRITHIEGALLAYLSPSLMVIGATSAAAYLYPSNATQEMPQEPVLETHLSVGPQLMDTRLEYMFQEHSKENYWPNEALLNVRDRLVRIPRAAAPLLDALSFSADARVRCSHRDARVVTRSLDALATAGAVFRDDQNWLRRGPWYEHTHILGTRKRPLLDVLASERTWIPANERYHT